MKSEKLDFLFLSQEDMIEAGVLDMDNCVDVMDKAFRLLWEGDYLMGGPSGECHGLRLWFPIEPKGPRMPVYGPARRFMSMIAYLGGEFNVCGMKWYGSNVENPGKRNLPRSIHVVVLNDPVTGQPLAIMDGTLISAMRTGAVVGLGAKYLANKDAQVAGIIGAGVISRTALMALSVALTKLNTIKVFDIVRNKAEVFSREMSEKLKIDVHPVDTLEEAVTNSDVISMAIAGPKGASFKSEWFKEGSFLALSSSMGELSDELWLTSKIVVDSWKMHLEWREESDKLSQPIPEQQRLVHFPLHQLNRMGKIKDEDIADLAQIAFGARDERSNDAQNVIFLTGGVAIEDVAWAYTVYDQALKQGIGQKLTLWNEPYWY